MVTVLGAGLSGLTAAVKLAEAGQKVTVFEKNSFVGGISIENIQAVRNYDLPFDQFDHFAKNGLKFHSIKPIHKIVKYAPSGKKMEVNSGDKPLFYAVKRGSDQSSLDYQLYGRSLEFGVKTTFNSANTLGNGNIIAVNSIFRNIWAYGAMFKGINVDPEKIIFFMDNDYCPQGYIYLIPYGKHEASIAATSFDLSCPLPILFKKFLKENEVVNEAISSASFTRNFSGFAYCNIPETAEIKGKKFVGSAAGFIDPARGFGIKYAIESGMMAAESITKNISYDSLWKKAFEKEFIENFKRRLFLEKLQNADYEKMVTGENINIKQYEKIPTTLAKIMSDIDAAIALKKWQEKYDIKKLFN